MNPEQADTSDTQETRDVPGAFILWLDFGLEGWADYRYATFAEAEEAAKDTWPASRWAITELLRSSDDDPALESSRP